MKSWFLLVTNMVLISYFLVVCLLIVRFFEVPEPAAPEDPRRVEGPTLGLFVRPFVRTTPHSQILCQHQNRVKNPIFNDKISDLWQIWVKFNDKISEMGEKMYFYLDWIIKSKFSLFLRIIRV